MTKLSFIACFFIGMSAAFGQAPLSASVFSDKPDEFIRQLGDFVNMSKREESAKVFANFEQQFKSGAFSDKEARRIMKTTGAMQTLKMNATPFFIDYLKAVVVVDKKPANQTSLFDQWHDVLDDMIARVQNRRFELIGRLLQFSFDFFDKNAIYYAPGATAWTADNRNYELKYEKGEPTVEWSKLTLTAALRKDSIEIKETAGAFHPVSGIWKGNSGKVSWARNKTPEVYSVLSDYSIDVSKGFYKAQNAKLHYPAFFPDADIAGNFEDKLNITSDRIENSYPRFESTNQSLTINNIGFGVQYKGGFKLYGNTAYGVSGPRDKARLTVTNPKTNKLAFRSASENYVIRKDESIVGEQTEGVIYFGADSIYHPSVDLKIDINKKEITLLRGARASERNPFYDSYHQVNINVGKIRWYFEKDSLTVGDKYPGFGINNNNAMFESLKYFSEPDYRRAQNIATVNPISVIKMYSDEVRQRTLNANDLAKKISPSMGATNMQSLLYELVSQGFVNYFPETQTVELKDKIFHYVNASQKKVDFDILRFLSETKEDNSTFTLKDTTIAINGIKNVELSERKRVALRPLGESIKLKVNRNFDFDGKLFAGFAIFQGKDYHFQYAPFQIKIDSARYMDVYLKIGQDKFNKPIAGAINSRLEHLNGVLLIDAPNNKSGREDVKLFPSFESIKNSFVYYDSPSTLDSIYKRDSFYYKLDKFTLSGMDSLTKDDLNFKGGLVSSDIFPEVRENLTLQPDSSLGFINKTPAEGYPVYKNKGKFTGNLELSNKGLLGKGVVKYLDAAISSKDIVFRPKDMTSSSKSFDLVENRGSNIPQVSGQNIKINWRPYKDSMYLSISDSSFVFFKEGGHFLRSDIVLTPGGVKGKGSFDWDKGRLLSKQFSFGSHSVSADTMDMSIKAITGADQLAFDTKNIKGKIDFDKQYGVFKANSADIQTNMPAIKYKTSINEFEWDLKNENITFKSDGGDATFLCSDPEQDSLRFSGKTAAYNLKSNSLQVGGAPYVQVCDAYIYTKNGDLKIELGGKMDSLTDAKIVCDTATKYHVINKANIKIRGKKFFEATGYYEYNIGSRQQEIRFDNITGQRAGKGQHSEKKTETRATGIIKPEDNFYIDQKTAFKGEITLNSISKNLKFDGFAKLDAENLPNKEWFNISSFADKKNLALQYSTPKNEKGEPLQTGLFVSKEAAVIYPSVMSPLYFRKDRPLIDAKGVFKYLPSTDEFVFGDSMKIQNSDPTLSMKGVKFVFNNKNRRVYAEGPMHIGAALNQIKTVAAGRAYTEFLNPNDPAATAAANANTDDSLAVSSIKAARTTCDVMLGINMQAPEKMLKIMAADIQAGSFDATDIEYNKDDFYEKTLAEFFSDPADYQRVVKAMKEKTLDIPDKYNPFNFFLAKIPMRWVPEYQSLISTDKKIAVQSISGIPINKNLTAYAEFKMPANEDDKINLYFKTSNDYYYLFSYQKGLLSLSSNNQRFEDEFNKMKPAERVRKMENGDVFEMQWIEPGSAEMFVKRLQNAK